MGAVIRAVYDFTGLGQATAAAPITVEQVTPFAAFFQGGGASGVLDGNYGDITVAGTSWTINAGAVQPADLAAGTVALFAPAAHGHAVADVTGLQAALDGKAATVHGHALADISGLQAALDGKSDTGHVHVIAQVTGLQAALDGKSATSHGHVIADVTGLQAALDAKLEEVTVDDISAAGTPSNTTYLRGDGSWATPAGGGGGASNWGELGGNLADQTDLQAALDGKAAASHGHDAATTSVAGFMSGADKTKLDGVAAGGTANDSDADLRDRATHTGTQGAGTITGLAAVATSGSASDLGSGTLPIARIADGAVTNAKLANMAANTVKGRANAASGVPGDIAIGASQVLGRGDSGNLAALSFGNGLAVSGTTAGLATAAEATIKGRASGAGTGVPADLTPSQVRAVINVADGATANATNAELRDRTTHTGEQAISTVTGLQDALDGKAAASHTHPASAISDSTAAGRSMLTAADAAAQTALLDTVTSGAKGLAPASGGGTTNFLRADGTWAAPPGGGGGNDWSDPVDSNIIPDADGTRDLGSNATRFDQAYVDELHVTEGIVLTEAADHPVAPAAEIGQLWVSNDATQRLMFTDDAGADKEVVFAGGGATVGAFTELLGLNSGAAVDVNSKSLLEARIGGVDLALATGDTYSGTHNFASATVTLPGAAVTALDLFTTSVRGVVPGSGGGTTNFLRADGTWAAPPGASGGDAWGDPVDADIIPDADGTRDLGSTAARFAELHVDAIDLNGTTIDGADGLADPNAPRIVFWHDSVGEIGWLEVGSGLSITGTTLTATGGGSGDVVGPASAADNAIVRFDGTTGKVVQNSGVTITDAGEVRLPYVATPAAPPADTVALFGRRVAGRMLPAFAGPSGLQSSLQALIARNKVGIWIPPGNATTVPGVFGIAAMTATGTATARNVATTNLFTRLRRLGYVSAGTAGSLAGIRQPALQYTTGDGAGLGGFFMVIRFGVAAFTSDMRMFVGLRATTAAPSNSEPSVFTNSVGVGCGAADSNLSIFYGGTSAQTPIGLGANFPAKTANTDVYELALFAPPGATGTIHYEVTRLNTGDVATGTLSGGAAVLPDSTVLLTALMAWVSNNATATAVGLDVASFYIETDY